jgi:hypothetical protein
MSSSGRRRRSKGGYSRYVALQHYMLKCLAWAGREEPLPAVEPLSPNAKALLVDIWQRHNGQNNGEISYSVYEARRIGMSKSRAARAFEELVERGFLRVGRLSTFHQKRLSRTWTLTAEPLNGEPATKDFMKWSAASSSAAKKNRNQSRLWDTQSHKRDYEAERATNEPPTVPPAGLSASEEHGSQSHLWDTSKLPGGGQANGHTGDGAPLPWRQPSILEIPIARAAERPPAHVNAITPDGDVIQVHIGRGGVVKRTSGAQRRRVT